MVRGERRGSPEQAGKWASGTEGTAGKRRTRDSDGSLPARAPAIIPDHPPLSRRKR